MPTTTTFTVRACAASLKASTKADTHHYVDQIGGLKKNYSQPYFIHFEYGPLLEIPLACAQLTRPSPQHPVRDSHDSRRVQCAQNGPSGVAKQNLAKRGTRANRTRRLATSEAEWERAACERGLGAAQQEQQERSYPFFVSLVSSEWGVRPSQSQRSATPIRYTPKTSFACISNLSYTTLMEFTR